MIESLILAIILSWWITVPLIFLYEFQKHCRRLSREQKSVGGEKKWG